MTKLRKLNVRMKDCCCYTCGTGSVDTYEIEGTYRDKDTLKPFTQYIKRTWLSTDEEPDAETIDGTLVREAVDEAQIISEKEYKLQTAANAADTLNFEKRFYTYKKQEVLNA
tara:strand:+ start:709 stop:1044 length:336 start_codon:yes stop_codon:yes gene_type:complete